MPRCGRGIDPDIVCGICVPAGDIDRSRIGSTPRPVDLGDGDIVGADKIPLSTAPEADATECYLPGVERRKTVGVARTALPHEADHRGRGFVLVRADIPNRR